MLSRGHGFLRSCWAPTPLWCSAVLALPTLSLWLCAQGFWFWLLNAPPPFGAYL